MANTFTHNLIVSAQFQVHSEAVSSLITPTQSSLSLSPSLSLSMDTVITAKRATRQWQSLSLSRSLHNQLIRLPPPPPQTSSNSMAILSVSLYFFEVPSSKKRSLASAPKRGASYDPSRTQTVGRIRVSRAEPLRPLLRRTRLALIPFADGGGGG